ncbi:MAG: aminodeoxychorismate/anthranilate synthase component II [Chloroflexi bacterium]|nr:aminodeoxychorismate/anthranilate synthase component II [Chloroflexota bacterium]
MILLVDNYDSFTYNLFQYLSELADDIVVRRHDALDLAELEAWRPRAIVISPGPGGPDEAGVSVPLIQTYGPRVPILGVCLGHQCIGQAYGGRVVRAGEIMHGKTSLIYHDGRGVFGGLPSPFEAIRYHSLVVARPTLPPELEVCAQTATGLIMGLRHRAHPVHGVQFHPESIMTDVGKDLLRTFLALAEHFWATAAVPQRAAS